jgi:hypothetical protein
LYVVLLSLLGAAAEQNDKHLAVPAEIDSIAGAAIDPQFREAFAQRLRVGRIALTKPVDGDRDPSRGVMVERIEPAPEGADILVGDEFLDADRMVPFKLPYGKQDSKAKLDIGGVPQKPDRKWSRHFMLLA